jgi:pyruvate/2-oxoglutarate dehydrogenase complex dihydrolipoamide dehydrogenase (E3) component
MSDVVDVVVVGLGPGGELVAGRLAEAGLDVVGIEGNLVGGECPYWGCVPSKMMIRAGDLLAEGLRIPGMAGAATVTPEWSPVAHRIRDEATDDWDDAVAVRRFEAKGGRFIRGWARLDGPGVVVVGKQRIEVRQAIVLNPGTRPWSPPIPGLADAAAWTNREAIEATSVPQSLVVLGGGAIGLELGQVFSRFGADVTIVEAADRLLALEEPESSELIEKVFARGGIRTVTSAAIAQITRGDTGFVLDLVDGDTIVGERLLVATGRRPDLRSLGIASIGLDDTGRSIPVDPFLRAAPGVWAIGDVTGMGAFTHVSTYQGAIAVADILGQNPVPADYRALPRVTFTDPEIGSVGLSESAARAAGMTVRTGMTEIATSARGWIHKAGNDGFIKLVEDADRGVLVGATSAGPVGGEVLGLLTLAIHASVPTAAMRHMIYAYPTFHRAVESALQDLGA